MATTTHQPMPIDEKTNRAVGMVLVLCLGGLLVFAAFLTPDQAGLGTHRQLGLPPCGFAEVTGYPCATCGCTTAFAHAANGSLLASVVTQPFGALLAMATAMMTLIAGWSAMSGMPLAPLGRILMNRRFILAWVALLLGAWGYKAVALSLGW